MSHNALFHRWAASWVCLLCNLVAHLSASAGTWYLAVQTEHSSANTTLFNSTFRGQYRVNSDAWTDISSMEWFNSGIYYNSSGLFVSHTGTFSMRLIRLSDSSVVGTVGPFSVTGGNPVASQPDRTITASFTPPDPDPWKLNKVFTNSTQTRQKFRVDSDGDGDWDAYFELGPGESHTISAESDAEPDWDMSVEREVYLGDGQWTYQSLETITPEDWEQTSGSPAPNPSTVPPKTYVPPDTQSSNTNSQKVAYGTASGGSLTESTFKTGIESLRSSNIEGHDKAAEAIDKLRAEVKNYLGFTNAANPTTTVDNLDQDSTANTFKSAMSTNAMTSAIQALDPGIETSDVSTNFWSITLPGGRVVRWDAPEWSPLMSFAKVLMAWAMYVVYFGFALKEGWKAIHHALGAPQAVSSSSVPGVSGGLAFASAVAIVLSYAALLSGFVVTLSGLLYGFEDLGTWQTFSMSSPTGVGPAHSTTSYWSLAERYVPLNFCLQLIIAGFIYEFTINAVAAGATAWVRLTAT